MSLDRRQPYFGFRLLPFRADLALSALYRSDAHEEAARIAFLISQGALGLITGEVGSARPLSYRRPPPRSSAAATP